MNARWLFLGFLSLALPLQAGWVIYLPEPLPNVVRIRYASERSEGYASFAEALKVLSSSGRITNLDGVIAFSLLAEPAFQQELFAVLQRDAPRELTEALGSAGNMHNPKMLQLQDPFLKAVLATPTVVGLNTALTPYGLTINKASIEKLALPKIETGRRFYGSLWLVVTKASN
ncbi:MAG: hypothetical protein JF599_11540 [Verrucomicrobia bacterium]|nr:hypothetical protein [Verrucomicrobiota bacterium]